MNTDSGLRAILAQFRLEGEAKAIDPMPGGHINRTWKVSTERGPGRHTYLLQRINEEVFRRPQWVMENVLRVLHHVRGELERETAEDLSRRVLQLVTTRAGEGSFVDSEGGVWRLFFFIEGTVSREAPESPRQAYEACHAFGVFQRHLASYAGPPLHETIPGFHDTTGRVRALERAVAADVRRRAHRAAEEIEALLLNTPLAGLLLDPFRRGDIPERIVHNDAKMSNVLFDGHTDRALCVIDLDTVMPGLSLYDVGDMLRSMACSAREDETALDSVQVKPEFVEAVAAGYLDAMGPLLTRTERALLLPAARLITYEQAVRFLTDFLEGDRYYRIERPLHNLDRTRTQLALLAALERAEPALRARIS